MTNTDELIELVAKGVRKARFERTGKGAFYDPALPLLETESQDAKASLEAIDQAGLVIMPKEDGRALREPALVSDQAPSGLAPTGFDPARVDVEIRYVVRCGTGHAVDPAFDNEAEAVARYEEELAIPSYFGAGHRRRASVVKITTVREIVHEGSSPAPLLQRDEP
jgi:hypothetical protein